MNRALALVGLLTALAVACGPAEDVEVQPLPALERLSQEARAGVPEVAGLWRFVGWELAPDDSASLKAQLPRFGALWVQTQRRDSIGGQYVLQTWRAPLYGEVRRDSVIALVGVLGPGDLRYLTGRVTRDTVWMALSSILEPGMWPLGARAAFVRTRAAAAPFIRLRGAAPPLARADSTGAPGALPSRGDSLAASRLPAPAGQVPGAAPGTAAPAPVARPAPTPGTAAPLPSPRRTPSRPTPPPPAAPEPEPSVPILGDPVAGDTVGG